MRAKIDLSKVDFRSTAVENIFLDTYLGQASGAAIKVYLYGWRRCLGESEIEFDIEEWADNLSLRVDEVQEALNYWVDENLIVVTGEGAEQILLFRSTMLLWAGLIESIAPEEQPVITLPQDVVENQAAKKELERKEMFDAIETFLSTGSDIQVALKPNEIKIVNEFLDEYQLQPGFYLYAYKKAASDNPMDTKSLPYINSMIDNWVRFDGVRDEASLDLYFEKREKIKAMQKARSRSSKKSKGEFVEKDDRMTTEERSEWVRKKLEQSRTANLRGGGGKKKDKNR